MIELAIQFASYDRSIREETIRDSKDFNSQTILTHSKKRKELEATLPATMKGYHAYGFDFVDLDTKNQNSRRQNR